MPRLLVEITTAEIDVNSVMRAAADPGAGAIVLFVGTVRDRSGNRQVIGMEYQAYDQMAREALEQIGREAIEKFGLLGLAIAHRIGSLDVGDVSIVIAASSEHRSEAFASCRRVIEAIKKNVPIWKREFFDDGSAWVDGEEAGGA